MPFKLERCDEDDMPRWFEIASIAFAHDHPYFDTEFPNHDQPSGRAAGSKRFRQTFRDDKHANWLKVVDDDGTIVAVAKWNEYDGVLPEEEEFDGQWWETDDEKKYAEYLGKTFLKKRRARMEEVNGHCICMYFPSVLPSFTMLISAIAALEFLQVDPKYHRRGAGRLLTQWGVKRADELGVLAIIEASGPGSNLYKQEGFEILDEYDLELPEEWKDRPKQRVRWMERQPKAKANGV